MQNRPAVGGAAIVIKNGKVLLNVNSGRGSAGMSSLNRCFYP
jgi:hypothetical protein